MAEEGQQEAAGGSGLPGWPTEGKFFEIDNFKGLNTQSPRQSIDDSECSYMENFFPIAEGNLRAMWDIGSSIYTAVGKTIVEIFFYNIGSNNYCASFFSDGTAIQINTSSMATTTISSTGGTFYTAGGSLPQAVQWGTSGILIVSSTSSNGYYAWDGTTLYSSGSTAPSWLSGLSSAIVVTGNTHTSTTIDSMSSTTGIQVGMTISGSGITAGTTVATIVSSTSITISAATSSSLTGTSLTFNWSMPAGLKGTAIELFQNRVWIASGATVSFSAAQNGVTFSSSLGGGSFTSSDSFLRNGYVSLKQANGYLYIFGDSSINYIGNVQTTVSGSTLTTTFNNLNTDPQVGTPWNFSVIPFGRAVMLANTSGIYAMFGGSAEKVSNKLDGLFSTATLPLTGITNMPSGAVATVFGIRVFFLLINAVDAFTNQSKPMMCAWDGNKWFIVTQNFTPTFIATQEINSQLTAWGTDGTKIYPMFQSSSTNITKKFQAKLWRGQSWIVDKQELRCYVNTYNYNGSSYSLNFSVDTDQQIGASVNFTEQGGFIQFIGSGGSNLNFTGLAGAALNFYATAGSIIYGQNIDSIYGKLMGITISSTSQDFVIVSIGMLYRNYRAYA